MDNPAVSKDVELNISELDEEEIMLMKKQTGIEDTAELEKHIQDVVGRAYKVFGYRYLTRMVFLKSKFALQPAYNHVLELGKSRNDAIFLDIGCGLGHDTRKAISDGYPIHSMIASDLEPEFWSLGHELFKSTPETFPVPFIPGDIFDDAFVPDKEPVLDGPASKERPTSLQSLTSLAPLQGHVSFIHASALFHLFQEEPQRKLAKKLASLLSPASGSMIFGLQRGSVEPKEADNTRGENIFCHSAESWKELWIGERGQGIFPPGMVEVQADLVQPPYRLRVDGHMLVWSVKRI